MTTKQRKPRPPLFFLIMLLLCCYQKSSADYDLSYQYSQWADIRFPISWNKEDIYWQMTGHTFLFQGLARCPIDISELIKTLSFELLSSQLMANDAIRKLSGQALQLLKWKESYDIDYSTLPLMQLPPVISARMLIQFDRKLPGWVIYPIPANAISKPHLEQIPLYFQALYYFWQKLIDLRVTWLHIRISPESDSHIIISSDQFDDLEVWLQERDYLQLSSSTDEAFPTHRHLAQLDVTSLKAYINALDGLIWGADSQDNANSTISLVSSEKYFTALELEDHSGWIVKLQGIQQSQQERVNALIYLNSEDTLLSYNNPVYALTLREEPEFTITPSASCQNFMLQGLYSAFSAISLGFQRLFLATGSSASGLLALSDKPPLLFRQHQSWLAAHLKQLSSQPVILEYGGNGKAAKSNNHQLPPPPPPKPGSSRSSSPDSEESSSTSSKSSNDDDSDSSDDESDDYIPASRLDNLDGQSARKRPVSRDFYEPARKKPAIFNEPVTRSEKEKRQKNKKAKKFAQSKWKTKYQSLKDSSRQYKDKAESSIRHLRMKFIETTTQIAQLKNQHLQTTQQSESLQKALDDSIASSKRHEIDHQTTQKELERRVHEAERNSAQLNKQKQHLLGQLVEQLQNAEAREQLLEQKQQETTELQDKSTQQEAQVKSLQEQVTDLKKTLAIDQKETVEQQNKPSKQETLIKSLQQQIRELESALGKEKKRSSQLSKAASMTFQIPVEFHQKLSDLELIIETQIESGKRSELRIIELEQTEDELQQTIEAEQKKSRLLEGRVKSYGILEDRLFIAEALKKQEEEKARQSSSGQVKRQQRKNSSSLKKEQPQASEELLD